MMAPRRRFREGDTGIVQVFSVVLRQKVIVGALWTLLGGGITALLMRLLLVTQLNAQENRLTRVESEGAAMKNSILVLTKSACLDRTAGEQALAGMDCPITLYKGVLQGVPRADSP